MAHSDQAKRAGTAEGVRGVAASSASGSSVADGASTADGAASPSDGLDAARLPTPASTADDTVLRLTNVTKSFGAEQAVEGVSLEIAAGESPNLLGTAVRGKATNIRKIAAIEASKTGAINICGQKSPAAEWLRATDARNATCRS